MEQEGAEEGMKKSSRGPTRGDGTSSNKPKRTMTCSTCGEKGHTKAQHNKPKKLDSKE